MMNKILKLSNTVQDYAWGSLTAIPDLLGRPPSGGPQAELWMGAHPKAPSWVDVEGRHVPLTDLIAEQPDEVPGNSLYYFVGIDKARFKRPVVPGDQLQLEVSVLKQRRGIWTFSAKGTVEGAVCASAEIMCTARDL